MFMFGWFGARPPMTTSQRVSLELLTRRTVDSVGLHRIRGAAPVTDIGQLSLDDSSPQRLLRSSADRVREWLPVTGELDLRCVAASDLQGLSKYVPAVGDAAAQVVVADETLGDPLRTLMEVAYQFSHHYWLNQPGHRDQDLHPAMTHLLPICCGLGVLASNASLYDQQWSQAGWTGWSMSRSGFYNAVEIGYALALLARLRRERSADWIDLLRLDSSETAKRAVRYFNRLDRGGGALLLDAERIPDESSDTGQLASWLRGDDVSFAYAAARQLGRREALPPLVAQTALSATREADRDLRIAATRLLGLCRSPSDEVSARVDGLIRSRDVQLSLTALVSAEQIGLPLQPHRSRISRLLQRLDDPLPLVELVGRQGKSFSQLSTTVCRMISVAVETSDAEYATALLRCLGQIVDRPRDAIEAQIKKPEIRSDALRRLEMVG